MAASLGSFDYVIVGGGTAGCLLANRLSADPDVRVLLIEAGGRDRWIWIDIPVGYIYCIGNPRTDWCYRTEPCDGLNGRSILYARGKVLGGCSSINAMIYMRGQREDYDAWAAATGDRGWSWPQVLPLFKRTENHYRGESEFHGAGGEWRVERQRLGWEILDAFQAAAEEFGIKPIDDFNTGVNEGSGKFEVNQRRGVRWSASKAFLRPVQKRPNLTVVTEALVRRLLLAAGRVTGVELERAGELTTAEARVETVLAAGSIGTPQIMQLSGIGPAGLLKQHGIAVAHELPGVGDNLQDHLQLRMAFRVGNVRTLNQIVHSWTGKARIGLEYLLFRTGPLTMAPSQLGIFTRSSPEHQRPNIEFHIQPLSLDRFGEPLHRFAAFTVSVCNLRPTSRGFVRITSPDPRQAPAIQPYYLSSAEDQQVAVDSLRLGRRIAAGAALARYHPEEFVPGPERQSDAELIRAAGDVGTTIFHPIGTCRMGRADDPAAVVDPRLRVRGLDGLRIVDASVMPTITSGNTNSPVIMIAERASDMIREDRRRRAGATVH